MRFILVTVVKEMKRRFNDPGGLIFAIMIPFVIGFLMASVMGGGGASIKARLLVTDLDEDTIFDIDQLLEHHLAFFGIRKLHHERCFPVQTVRNQGVVGLKFLINAIRFENSLDAQHFLNLILHRHAVFEIQGRIATKRKAPIAFVFENLTAKFIAQPRVLLEAVEVVTGQFLHRVHSP